MAEIKENRGTLIKESAEDKTAPSPSSLPINPFSLNDATGQVLHNILFLAVQSPDMFASITAQSLLDKNDFSQKERRDNEKLLLVITTLTDDILRLQYEIEVLRKAMEEQQRLMREKLVLLQNNLQESNDIVADIISKDPSLASAGNAVIDIQNKKMQCIDGMCTAIDSVDQANQVLEDESASYDEKQIARKQLADNLEKMETAMNELEGLLSTPNVQEQINNFVTQARVRFANDPETLAQLDQFEDLRAEARARMADLKKLKDEYGVNSKQYLNKIKELTALSQKFDTTIDKMPEDSKSELTQVSQLFDKQISVITDFETHYGSLRTNARTEALQEIERYKSLEEELSRLKEKISIKEQSTSDMAEAQKLWDEVKDVLENTETKNRANFIKEQYGGFWNFHKNLNGKGFFTDNPDEHVLDADGNVVFKQYETLKDENGKALRDENGDKMKGNVYYAEIIDPETGDSEKVEIKGTLAIAKLEHQAWVDGKPFGNETRYGEFAGVGLATSLLGSVFDRVGSNDVSTKTSQDIQKELAYIRQKEQENLEEMNKQATEAETQMADLAPKLHHIAKSIEFSNDLNLLSAEETAQLMPHYKSMDGSKTPLTGAPAMAEQFASAAANPSNAQDFEIKGTEYETTFKPGDIT